MSQGSPDTSGLLRMGDLAEQAGVSPATVKHYLREGLLESEADAA